MAKKSAKQDQIDDVIEQAKAAHGSDTTVKLGQEEE